MTTSVCAESAGCTMSGCLEAEPGTDVNFQDVSTAPLQCGPGPVKCPRAAFIIRKQLVATLSDGQREEQAWGRTLQCALSPQPPSSQPILVKWRRNKLLVWTLKA